MKDINYNNLSEIDELIERLEQGLPKEKSPSEKVNKAYEERRRKIIELRRLQQEAREELARKKEIETAEKNLGKIESENRELDDMIEGIKRLIKKPTVQQQNNNTSSYPTTTHWSYQVGESNNGESRW